MSPERPGSEPWAPAQTAKRVAITARRCRRAAIIQKGFSCAHLTRLFPGLSENCHDLLKWLIPVRDKFPSSLSDLTPRIIVADHHSDPLLRKGAPACYLDIYMYIMGMYRRHQAPVMTGQTPTAPCIRPTACYAGAYSCRPGPVTATPPSPSHGRATETAGTPGPAS